jgi:hypothetical protein
MSRLAVLRELIEFDKPLKELKKNLLGFDWDFEGEPFIVDVTSVRKILERFINESYSASEIYEWANLVECREDLEFEESRYQALDSVIEYLANPALHGKLTAESCVELLGLLSSPS